jgi:DNA-binding beta-propeller fold protein YncE
MLQGFRLRPIGCGVVFTCLIGIAVCVQWGGEAAGPELSAASQGALRRPSGIPQLVSMEPLPVMDGEMCEWTHAGTSMTQLAALRQSAAMSRAASGALDEGKISVDIDRAPVRVIRDTYPAYSSVGVDTDSNEVYLQDENLFGYKVFNRLENTPPAASFTEPKRIVGGDNTKMNFNCALYIDPKSGDVYSVNNDTVNTLVVFPRQAKGNVAPKRELKTPHGTFGIAVDEDGQELYLTVEHTNSVVVYRKEAKGNEKPLRTLEGDQTHLEDPHGIAFDPKNDLIYVANHGNYKNTKPPISGNFESASITVYPMKARGDTPPLRIIQGLKTQLNWPSAMYFDPEHEELFVANDSADSILIFRSTDSGDVAPLRAIKGPRTGLKSPTGVFVDAKNQEIWVSNMGNHTATVYRRNADGDATPLRTIRSGPLGKLALSIGNPGAAGYDSKRDEILVPN